MKKFILTLLSKSSFMWKKHGATILTVSGSAMMVVGTILSCKATLKVDQVLTPHEEEKEKIEAVHSGIIAVNGPYTEQDYKTDLLKVKTRTAKDLVKLYLPAGLTMLSGLLCIGAGHHMMRSRIAATATSLALLETRFNKYRDRVKTLVGEEEEELIYKDIRKEVSETTDEKGTVVKETSFKGNKSPYILYYDETNPNWRGREDEDFTFLKRCQSEMQDLLYINGHLFINTIRAHMGYKPTKAGQIAGYVQLNDGTTDNYVDFGIFNRRNGTVKDWALDMYRKEHRVIIDLNCDGNIIDKIDIPEV